MSFPLKDFLQRAFDLVLRQTGEDIAYTRIVLFDGVYESIISVDPHAAEHNLLVSASIHHEGNNINQSFHYGGGVDTQHVFDGIQSDFSRTGIKINAVELYKWINHRDHEQHIKRVEKVLDQQWTTDLTEEQTRDLRDRDVMNNYISGLVCKLLPWWRPVSEGHVEAQWSTGCNEEALHGFAAWIVLVALPKDLDFFASSNLSDIGREVNNSFDRYTNSDRHLHNYDPKSNLWKSLEAFRTRSLPAIVA